MMLKIQVNLITLKKERNIEIETAIRFHNITGFILLNLISLHLMTRQYISRNEVLKEENQINFLSK